jgi:crotonobetainyl-CoA:carnitine CoA-transferase CaiB-like acyl-CoA transferase
MSPARFSEFPQTLEVQTLLLGKHNAKPLGRHLWYSLAQVKQLERKGVLGHRLP